MRILHVLAVLAPLVMVLALVGPWMARNLRGPCCRLAALARRSPVEALFVLLFVGVFVVYGSTKSPTIRIDGYSGTYDGMPHTVTVRYGQSSGGEMDVLSFAENEDGPYDQRTPPQYVDAGSYIVYYRIRDLDDYVKGRAVVEIIPRVLPRASIDDVPPQPYAGGLPIEPPVSFSTMPLVTTNDYVVSYSNNVDIGQATFVVVGTNNFSGRLVRRFNITTPSGGSVVPPAQMSPNRRMSSDHCPRLRKLPVCLPTESVLRLQEQSEQYSSLHFRRSAPVLSEEEYKPFRPQAADCLSPHHKQNCPRHPA